MQWFAGQGQGRCGRAKQESEAEVLLARHIPSSTATLRQQRVGNHQSRSPSLPTERRPTPNGLRTRVVASCRTMDGCVRGVVWCGVVERSIFLRRGACAGSHFGSRHSPRIALHHLSGDMPHLGADVSCRCYASPRQQFVWFVLVERGGRGYLSLVVVAVGSTSQPTRHALALVIASRPPRAGSRGRSGPGS